MSVWDEGRRVSKEAKWDMTFVIMIIVVRHRKGSFNKGFPETNQPGYSTVIES